MMDQSETDRLIWRDGEVPVATRFDDPYFSLEDGLAETRHTFLDGNDLPARFAPGFHVAELGFGTGLNLLAVWAAWETAGQTGALRFTSFEAFPLSPAEMDRALAAFPALSPWRDRLMRARSGDGTCFEAETLQARVILGDARETLPRWQGRADAWFLDGFSPARNPELWQPDLLAEVGRHTAPGGSCATYTAAGHVRRALQEAGFAVERAPGFGRKRHMTKGILA